MNSCHFIGRLTKDIELRYSDSNVPHASFTLAVNRQFKKEGEERQADFLSCKVFGKTAEFMGKYFSKGRQVGIDGRIQTGSYEKDGAKVYTTDLIVERVHFADDKKNDAGAPRSYQDAGSFAALEAQGEDELPF